MSLQRPEKVIPLVSVLGIQRRMHGLTLPELAAITCIDKGTLSRYERGLTPTPEHARRLAEALAAAAREGGEAA
jgi:transcriptional regulator with XRE-family HTH domain